MPTGMLARERIVEAVLQHGIIDLGGAHPVAPPRAVHEVGRGIHVLHTARDGRVQKTKLNFSGRGCYRLSARTTDAIDGHRRNFDGNATTDGGLSGRVHLVAGLNDIAHDDGADGLARDACPFQTSLDHRRAQFHGRRIFQSAIVGSDRRAYRRADQQFAL